MELAVGKNSYMTLEEADTLLNEELFSDDEELEAWNNLAEEDKTKLIIKGTREVDHLPFLGIKYNIDSVQPLQWPRVLNNQTVECPREVKLGLLKQTLRSKINKGKKESKLLEMGVKEYKIKDASISFSDKNYTKLSNGIYSDIYLECFNRWTY